ncbi:MAG TPA: amidohydrolase family protein, partial [Thermoanaerobaculia bacterium]
MENGTIFSASTILAGASQQPIRDGAVYVTGGRIREVGSSTEIRRAHPNARVVDAPGATILPGLIDAHAHLYGLGLSLDQVDLTGTSSFDEVIARMKPRAASSPSNEWIEGRGWDQTSWPAKEFPTAAALDGAISDHPVWLKRVDGHAGLANSVAMRLAGISAATPDPEGGRLIRDANGNPTGVFVDHALSLIESRIPEATYAQVKRRVLAAAQRIAENGLTEIHDAGAGGDTMRAVRELVDEKKFPI